MKGPGWKPAVEPMFRIRPPLRATMPGQEQPGQVGDGVDVHLDQAHLAGEIQGRERAIRAEAGVVDQELESRSRARRARRRSAGAPRRRRDRRRSRSRRRRARREAASPAPRAGRAGAPPARRHDRRRRTASPAPSPGPPTPRSPAPFFPIPVSPSAVDTNAQVSRAVRLATLSALAFCRRRRLRAGRHAGRDPRPGRAALGRRRAGGRALRLRGPRPRGRAGRVRGRSRDALAQALGVRARFVQNDWSNADPVARAGHLRRRAQRRRGDAGARGPRRLHAPLLPVQRAAGGATR